MSLCSELENMDIIINYYNFIKDIFDDYIKYISNYKIINSEYIKKLTQLQEKYGSKLTGKEKDNTKYKNIKTNHIYSITSSIPKIIDKQLENLKLYMAGLDSQLDNYNIIIKEKDILTSKFQLMFEEATKDLLKKYKDIDKLRDLFISNMEATEDCISNYLKRDNSICNIIPTYDNSIYTKNAYKYLCLKPNYVMQLPTDSENKKNLLKLRENIVNEIRMYQIKLDFIENDKIRKYRKIKKQLFSFNGIFSSKKYFYEKNKYICKYRY